MAKMQTEGVIGIIGVSYLKSLYVFEKCAIYELRCNDSGANVLVAWLKQIRGNCGNTRYYKKATKDTIFTVEEKEMRLCIMLVFH